MAWHTWWATRAGTPDVSMSAAVDGGVVVSLGYTNTAYGVSPGWYVVGGTSEATPVFSGIVAIADQAAHHDLGRLNPTLYALGGGSRSGIADITAGNNSVSGTQQLPPIAGQTFAAGAGPIPALEASRSIYTRRSRLGGPVAGRRRDSYGPGVRAGLIVVRYDRTATLTSSVMARSCRSPAAATAEES